MNALRHKQLGSSGRRVLAALLAMAWVLAAAQTSAQAPKRPFRIGTVTIAPVFETAPNLALVQGLGEQGLIQGRDYVIEFRTTGGDPARQAALVDELIQLPVDAFLVSVCGEPLNTMHRRTRTIPIVVMTCNEDMVESGLVKSLNRPGGNITGQSKLAPELSAKRLELLREVLPTARRVAVLWNPAYSAFAQDWHELRAAAQKLGITLESVEFRRASELDAALAKVERLRPDALMAFSDVSTYLFAKRIAERTVTARLPSIFTFREVADAGALMSYGPSITGMYRHGASYFARIMRGASPGELPIEMPTRFELVINQKAARALGIKVPDTVLLRADDIIE
jgi:putative tryptophan/tyrosine transport system substrate-binding protein